MAFLEIVPCAKASIYFQENNICVPIYGKLNIVHFQRGNFFFYSFIYYLVIKIQDIFAAKFHQESKQSDDVVARPKG